MSEEEQIKGLPAATASTIEWHCWCGYIGWYSERDAHLDAHRQNKEKPNG